MNPIGRCLKHAESAAAFRCRLCNDLGCVRCRARGERNLCDTCASYRAERARIEAQGGIDALLARRRGRRPWGRWLIAALVGFVLGLLVICVVFPWPMSLILPDTRAGSAAISVFVKEHRDSTGRYPMAVDSLSDRLRPDAAELQRRGIIIRRTPPDRGEYEAEIAPLPVTPAR